MAQAAQRDNGTWTQPEHPEHPDQDLQVTHHQADDSEVERQEQISSDVLPLIAGTHFSLTPGFGVSPDLMLEIKQRSRRIRIDASHNSPTQLTE